MRCPITLIPHARVLLAGASGGFRVAEVLRARVRRTCDALEPEPVLLRRAAARARSVACRWPTIRACGCSATGRSPAAADGGRYDIIDLSADFLDAAEANATAFTVRGDRRAICGR